METVAVVGNANSLFDREYGQLIDSHDKVIRFNRGTIKDPKAQGEKTSLVITFYKEGWTVKQDIYYHWDCDVEVAEVYPHVLREEMGCHPSTLMAYLWKLPEDLHVSIFGVDHNKTGTFYRKETYPHNWDREEMLLSKMLTRPTWSIYR